MGGMRRGIRSAPGRYGDGGIDGGGGGMATPRAAMPSEPPIPGIASVISRPWRDASHWASFEPLSTTVAASSPTGSSDGPLMSTPEGGGGSTLEYPGCRPAPEGGGGR